MARRAGSAELRSTNSVSHVSVSLGACHFVSSTVGAFIPRRADLAGGHVNGVLVVASDVLAVDVTLDRHCWIRAGIGNLTIMAIKISFAGILASIASYSFSITNSSALKATRADERGRLGGS